MSELENKHTEIYKEFLPTLQRYTEMASEALALQVALYTRYLDTFHSRICEAPLILKFSARETPATVRGLIKELQDKQVNVARVVYDPARHEFFLFGNV